MKTILSALFLMMCSATVFAQDEQPLQFDESNKYVYYKIEDMAGVSADTLYQRGWEFAKAFSPRHKPSKGKAAYAFNTKGSFMVYSGSSIVRKEAGAVSYTLNIETKDGKYRYKLSDFVLKPYKRDRFSNMTAQPGLDIPAEKLSSKYTPKETDSFLAQIAAYCKSAGIQLKGKMEKVAILHAPQPAKKIDTDNW